jgi:glutamate racemase
VIWGVFDSGVGGLTVVRAMREHHETSRLVYLGDTARVPYGIRSRATVRRYAEEAAEFFAGASVDGVIVACNTASAVALDRFVEIFRGPVLGVVEPGVRAALAATVTGRIGVIGTAATIRSDAYGRRLTELDPTVQVVSRPCPLFVPLAEEGWIEGEVPELAARRYLAPMIEAGVDVVILGCTHYPLLKPVIGRVMQGARLVDSAQAVSEEAARMRRRIEEGGGADPAARSVPDADRFCVTDAGGSFAEVARRFLGDEDVRLEVVSLGHHD